MDEDDRRLMLELRALLRQAHADHLQQQEFIARLIAAQRENTEAVQRNTHVRQVIDTALRH